jgi:hypothetical protein
MRDIVMTHKSTVNIDAISVVPHGKTSPMNEFKDLKRVIEHLHRCKSSYVESVAVNVKDGSTVQLQGIVHIIVHVFRIEGHSLTDRCYAWASLDSDIKKPRYYAVLHIPPADSAMAAVRLAIA